MSYRMNELEELTGVPRTTIHYYLREGLLPAGEKTARNAALYGEEHRRRLDVIRKLREGPTPAPLSAIRRALTLIEKGVDPEVAVSLQRSVLGDQTPIDETGRFGAAELAERIGIDEVEVRALSETGVLLPAPGADPPFDGLDLAIGRQLGGFVRLSGMDPSELVPVAEAIRWITANEMALRDRLVEGQTADESARLSAAGQDFVNAWHAYLFYRTRAHEISRRGLGVAADHGDGVGDGSGAVR